MSYKQMILEGNLQFAELMRVFDDPEILASIDNDLDSFVENPELLRKCDKDMLSLVARCAKVGFVNFATQRIEEIAKDEH